jgi:hypothetical protein
VAALGIGLISFKRWRLALTVISLLLIAFSLISFAGIYTLAPAVFWFGCAIWLWAKDRRVWIALSALVTVALVSFGVTGVFALVYLAEPHI